MNELSKPEWRNKGSFEDSMTCSVYFYITHPQDGAQSNITGGAGSLAVTDGKYVKYHFAYFEYFMDSNNRNIAVYHGAGFHGTGAKPGDAVSLDSAPAYDEGMWNIYEMDSAGNYTYFGTV
jgi:hypothetical protein